MVTSLCRSAVLRTGGVGTLTQLEEVRSVFCWRVKSKDGTSQETTALVPEGRMRSNGEKVTDERWSV